MAKNDLRTDPGKFQNEMTWEKAVIKILSDAAAPLHYAEIADRIAEQGLRKNMGATPASSVAATFSNSIKNSGDSSPFLKVGGGIWSLRQTVTNNTQAIFDQTVPDDLEQQEISGALRAFGMFWQRDLVLWPSRVPKMLGRANFASSPVNFAKQVGVYLLHDRERVIYVGRATESIFDRLKMHTTDRLGGRWDRFSWFGTKSVSEAGDLSEYSKQWSHEIVIITMEALLIESLEPPLNRKRGDDIGELEYIQVLDPDIERQKQKAIFEDIKRKVYDKDE